MVDVIVGAHIVNKAGVSGVIAAFDGECITVDFPGRTTKFLGSAFEEGYLRYEDAQLQNKALEAIEKAKQEAEQKAEEERLAAEQAKQAEAARAQAAIERAYNNEITFKNVKVMLDPVDYSLNSVKPPHRVLVNKIFKQCNQDIQTLFAQTDPKMTYPKITSYARSKHCTGFLCKYSDVLVFRVFSRNDVYKKRIKNGVTVMESIATEIYRVMWVENEEYHFMKNCGFQNGYFYTTVNANRWTHRHLSRLIMLNDVIRCCDCGYLNNVITEKGIDVNCQQYLQLLIPALKDNKVEIVFKNKGFTSAFRIDDIVSYLREFTPKQIDFASKNNVLNTLPIIKQYGISDLAVLRDMETLMRNQGYRGSAFSALSGRFEQLGFDCTDLAKKLIQFTKKVDFLDAGVYFDYIYELAECPGVTEQDFFDKNYIERHNVLHRELMERRARERAERWARYYQQSGSPINDEKEKYEKVAKELAWINREENGYFIIVPKNIDAFMDEGMMQHNCVYGCRYYHRVIEKQSIIVFLRKEENVSFVTIEFDYDTFEVMQALGKYNQRIDPKLYQYVVDLGKRLNYERHTQL